MALGAAWLGTGLWQSAKPLPKGLHLQSSYARLGEAEVELLAGAHDDGRPVARALGMVGAAEQLIIVDQSPLRRELAQALLLRKHARPNLKMVVITDPLSAGGAQQDLLRLERAGVIVARVKLAALRDTNFAYSGPWRLALSWWNSPPELERLNHKSDARQVLIADDGSGGWLTLLGALDADLTALLHGPPAEELMASELAVAAWSADDERLPAAPPAAGRRVGTIDLRHLSEGAVAQSLRESLATARAADAVDLALHALSERGTINAILAAAKRRVRVRIVLDSIDLPNTAVADELHRAGVEVRWNAQAPRRTQLFLLHHGGDLFACLATASFSRRGIGDFDLANGAELRAPAQSGTALALGAYFNRAWSRSATYGLYARESSAHYWRYRLGEALGSDDF